MGQMCTVVRPDEVVALERCGSFQGIYGPGFQFLGPDWMGMCNVTKAGPTHVPGPGMRCPCGGFETPCPAVPYLLVCLQRITTRIVEQR
eukprot:gene10122-8963_t